MREIEVLVRILVSKKKAVDALKSFKKQKTVRMVDSYYFNSDNPRMSPIGKRAFTEFLRVRQQHQETRITHKKDIFAKDGSWLYSDEHEMSVSDSKIAKKIITALGLKPLVVVENMRTYYIHGSFEICLEDVKHLGLFLEVEYKNPGNASAQSIRKKLFRFIDSLHIPVSSEVTAGKPELLWRKLNANSR